MPAPVAHGPPSIIPSAHLTIAPAWGSKQAGGPLFREKPRCEWKTCMALMDDLLEGLRLRSTVSSRMTLSGDWGYAKDALEGAPFHLVLLT